ncbi:MAG: hypothetical protein JO279_03600 [Verrucomicrobia bacterium]|nr:hypothetical protein [Verrucomicrobiota bacterium]
MSATTSRNADGPWATDPKGKRTLTFLSGVLSLVLLAPVSALAYTNAGGVYTSNGTDSDTQAAINAAPAGSTVQIPNGTYNWANGISCSTAIKITGASIGGVTILDNQPNGPLVALTPVIGGTLEFCNLVFQEGPLIGSKNGQHFIVINYAPGSSPILLHDSSFYSKGDILSQILWEQNGGVVWNCTFDSGSTNAAPTNDEQIQFKYPTTDRWQSVDSMGMEGDPNGTLNTYIEDCTFQNEPYEMLDCDDGSRVVVRHCTLYGTCVSHGADSSPFGTRHWEYYDNSFLYPYSFGDSSAPNLQGWLTQRGGTGVITGNSFCPVSSENRGTKSSVNWLSDAVTEYRCYTEYPIPRALGQGWCGCSGSYSYPQAPEMGSGYTSDPVYVWGNTSNNTYQSGSADTYGYVNNDLCNNGLTTQDFITAGRDYFFDSGAKPGWTRYTYPHPLRSGAASAPLAPTSLKGTM